MKINKIQPYQPNFESIIIRTEFLEKNAGTKLCEYVFQALMPKKGKLSYLCQLGINCDVSISSPEPGKVHMWLMKKFGHSIWGFPLKFDGKDYKNYSEFERDLIKQHINLHNRHEEF